MTSEREVEISSVSAQLRDAEEAVREYRGKLAGMQENMENNNQRTQIALEENE
jgi:hypothetical protein